MLVLPVNQSPTLSSDQVAQIGNDPAISFALAALGFDLMMREKCGIPAITPASRLLFFMKSRESVSLKEAMLAVPLSYRAFYAMLDKLKAKKLINVQADTKDRRVKRLVLGAKFRRIEVQFTSQHE
jgi:hypothetical protein